MTRKTKALERQLEILREELQVAIDIELTTIAPYLSALYSIAGGANREAQANIRAVVMQEMLHMTLAANVLNAVGGRPRVGKPPHVPGYPTNLPWHKAGFSVELKRFSPEQIDVFCAIEAPARMDPLRARPYLLDPKRIREAQRKCPRTPPPEPKGYRSIAQVYAALAGRLHWLVCRLGPEQVFTGEPARQVHPEHYYGADGAVIVVRDLKHAVTALARIVHEGEGAQHKIWDGDHELAVPDAPAHYYLLDEIRKGRHYRKGDAPNHPSGPAFRIDWHAVHPMRPNPRRSEYARRFPEIHRKLAAFDAAYLGLLGRIDAAYNGQPGELRAAVAQMYALRDRAIELMRIPDPFAPGSTVGPSFGSIVPPTRRHGVKRRTPVSRRRR
jgi:hypothetical protein